MNSKGNIAEKTKGTEKIRTGAVSPQVLHITTRPEYLDFSVSEPTHRGTNFMPATTKNF